MRTKSHWFKSVASLALAATIGAAPTPAPRVVAIGDLHGDLAAWRAITRAAGVEDATGHWRGGRTVLVQLGDVVDRGADGRRLVLELMRLQREAARAGGRVVALVGNHEAMNMTGDLRYVTPADYAAYADAQSERRRDGYWRARRAELIAAGRARTPGASDAAIERDWRAATPPGAIEHAIAWAPDGMIGRWVAGNPAVALIDGTIFVHGGIGDAYTARSADEINRAVAAALRARDEAPTAIISDPAGPLWYRGLAVPGAEAAAEVGRVLAAWHARRMVIAHTPSLRGIVVAADGRLIRIDSGISAAIGGTPSYLEINGDGATPHIVPRPPAGEMP